MQIKLDIPDSFYLGEERCDYYVQPNIKRLWAVQLDLLSEFARVCDKHNIKYFVDGGTLLGAVRHKGFIPWDDDVDVVLMREDFERLCEIAHFEFKYPYYFALPEEAGYSYLTPFSKFFNDSTTSFEYINFTPPPMMHHGVFLDVFPMDGMQEVNGNVSRVKTEKILDKAIKYYRMTDGYYPAKTPWIRPIKATLHRILKLLHLTYGDYMKKYKRTVSYDSKYIFNIYNKRVVLNREDYNNVAYLPFEMLTVPVPSGYMNVLEAFFGNWHVFVKDHPVHSVYLDIDHPWSYYINSKHPLDEKLLHPCDSNRD